MYFKPMKVSFNGFCDFIYNSLSTLFTVSNHSSATVTKIMLTIPNWLSFLTSQGNKAVDPIWALTVDAFLVIKTHSAAGIVSRPNVTRLLLSSLFPFWSWMAWLGDHSWRRWRKWCPCSWLWWWWWWWWWLLPCSCWCQPSIKDRTSLNQFFWY